MPLSLKRLFSSATKGCNRRQAPLFSRALPEEEGILYCAVLYNTVCLLYVICLFPIIYYHAVLSYKMR